MTSQDTVTSKSHTFQDHHGDVRYRVWERDATECRVGGPFPVSWHFPDSSPPFPCLTVAFFLSFFLLRLRGFSFLFFVSLLFLFVLVHGHFCSVVVGFSIPQPPFPSSQYVIPSEKIHMHDECWLQGDFFVTCTVWRNESATLTQLCQNTSVRRLQVCFRGGSAAGGHHAAATAHRSRDVGGREAGIHAHEWKRQEAPLPHCLFEKSHQASPSSDKAKIAMCTRMPVCLDVERPLDLGWGDWTRNFPRRHSHREQKRSGDRILVVEQLLLHFKRKAGQRRYGQAKKFEETTKVTCWWRRDADVAKFAIEDPECTCVHAARGHVRWHATVLHDNNTEG